MTLALAPLFTLRATHEFYGGVCTDLEFVVPPDTARLLRAGSAILKARGGSVLALQTVDGAGAPLVPLAGRTLRFGFRAQNPLFGNFTAGLDPAAGVRLSRNSASPAALDTATMIPLLGRSLRHAPSLPSRPVTITLGRPELSVLVSETVTPEHDREHVSFDLSLWEPGELRIEESYSDTSRATRRYLDPALLSRGVLGIVEITVDPSFYTAPPTFDLPFSARADTLKYYVVTNYLNGDLRVADRGYHEQARSEVQFERVTSFGPGDIPAAALAGADQKVLLFVSSAPVPRRQSALKGIHLLRDTDVLLENLPQPGAARASADVIIHLLKG